MKRALLALESAREINDNAEILPSYKVFLKLLRVVRSGTLRFALPEFFPSSSQREQLFAYVEVFNLRILKQESMNTCVSKNTERVVSMVFTSIVV